MTVEAASCETVTCAGAAVPVPYRPMALAPGAILPTMQLLLPEGVMPLL